MIGPVYPIPFAADSVGQRERGTHDAVDDGRELIAWQAWDLDRTLDGDLGEWVKKFAG